MRAACFVVSLLACLGAPLQLGAEPADRPPERLGAWKLGEKLGVGGMGEVWAAERIAGGFTQRAAVKLVRSGVSSLEIAARFRRERQVLARLSHAAEEALDGEAADIGRRGRASRHHHRELPLRA